MAPRPIPPAQDRDLGVNQRVPGEVFRPADRFGSADSDGEHIGTILSSGKGTMTVPAEGGPGL